MAATDALYILSTLLQLPDAAGTKQQILAIAQAAGLDTTSFTLGEPTERWIEIAAEAMGAWGVVPTQATRSLFMRLATDPGDVADDGVPDQSADQTPRPGFLSAIGAGLFGTIRGGQLFAATSETITNATGQPVSFKPGALVFERNYVATTGGSPTYTNTPAPSIYVNLDGSVTLPSGASVTVPIVAQQIGSYASATSGSINILVTQSLGALTATNPSGALGQDRESRSAYIARCLLAPDSNAPGGPTKAYQRACNTTQDGTTLANYMTGSPVGILGAQVLPSSANSVVTGYLYGPSGPVGSVTDVSSANCNMIGIPSGLITNPVGVLPDAVAIGPNTTDPVTTIGFSDSTAVPIAVTYTARMNASAVPGGATPGTYTSGGSNPPTVSAVFQSIAAALLAYLPALGPGALDQVAGAGVVYTTDLGDIIRDAQAGLRAVTLSLPAASTTAIGVGHIPTQGTTLGTLVLV